METKLANESSYFYIYQQLSKSHHSFLSHQAESHKQFLSSQQRSWQTIYRCYQQKKTTASREPMASAEANHRQQYSCFQLQKDDWLKDYRPTFSVASLPLMVLLDAMAQAVKASLEAGACQLQIIGFKDVELYQHLICEDEIKICWHLEDANLPLAYESEGLEEEVEHAGNLLAVKNITAYWQKEGERETKVLVAKGVCLLGSYQHPPALISEDQASKTALYDCPLPYLAAQDSVFQGPAFQHMVRLKRGYKRATSVLDCQPRSSSLPPGLLYPSLLDAASHAFTYRGVQEWIENLPKTYLSYPVAIVAMQCFAPLPVQGSLRCENRLEAYDHHQGIALFHTQLIGQNEAGEERLLMAWQQKEKLVASGLWAEACSEKGQKFLRQEVWEGLCLSRHYDSESRLSLSLAQESNWFPSSLKAVYASESPYEILFKEYVGAKEKLHPRHIPQAIPLTEYPVSMRQEGGDVVLEPLGPASLQSLEAVHFWRNFFQKEAWVGEDLLTGLLEQFVNRVVLTDPQAFESLRGQGVVFVSNHQVGIDALLFAALIPAIHALPIATFARLEHKYSLLGRLTSHLLAYPGLAPRAASLLTYLDRSTPQSVEASLQALGKELDEGRLALLLPLRSGKRAFTTSQKSSNLSQITLEWAQAKGHPLVPVRITGGLGPKGLERPLQFPYAMSKIDIWIGKPIDAHELSSYSFESSREAIFKRIYALNALSSEDELKFSDENFAHKVHGWMLESGMNIEYAVIFSLLKERYERGLQLSAESLAILEARLSKSIKAKFPVDVEGWLYTLTKWLLGHKFI